MWRVYQETSLKSKVASLHNTWELLAEYGDSCVQNENSLITNAYIYSLNNLQVSYTTVGSILPFP